MARALALVLALGLPAALAASCASGACEPGESDHTSLLQRRTSLECNQAALDAFVNTKISPNFKGYCPAKPCGSATCGIMVNETKVTTGGKHATSEQYGPACPAYQELAYAGGAYYCQVNATFLQEIDEFADKYLPKAWQQVQPKIGIYHGGMVGYVKDGSNSSRPTQPDVVYVESLGNFAKSLTQRVGIKPADLLVLFSLSKWVEFTPAGANNSQMQAMCQNKSTQTTCQAAGCTWHGSYCIYKGNGGGGSGAQYPYLANPSFLAKYFADHLATVAPGASAGLVPYLRPKDSGYTWNLSAWGGSPEKYPEVVDPGPGGCPGYFGPQFTDYFGKVDCKTISSLCGTITDGATCSKTVGCKFQTSHGYCEADSGVCFEGGVGLYPDNCMICDTKCKELSPSCNCTDVCPKGCPNDFSQVVQYMEAVNDKTTKGTLLNTIVADGEDLGLGKYTWEQDKSAVDMYVSNAQRAQSFSMGEAKSILAAASGNSSFPNIVMPETYWYMNELWPCGGDQWQLKHKPAICTNETSYRYFANDPARFLSFLILTTRRAGNTGLEALKNLDKAKKSQTWPMFSFENLSLDRICLALKFYQNQSDALSDVCGTFDGFSYWDLDKFYSFLQLFAKHYGFGQLGIYEAQFIPPEWMPFPTVKFPPKAR